MLQITAFVWSALPLRVEHTWYAQAMWCPWKETLFIMTTQVSDTNYFIKIIYNIIIWTCHAGSVPCIFFCPESTSPVFFYILYKTIITHYRRNLNTQLLYCYQTYIDLPLKHTKPYSLKYSISTSKFFLMIQNFSQHKLEQFDKHFNM